jgi:hypothetical protein
LTLKVRNSYQQVHELISGEFDSKSKSSEQQDVSKLLALSGAVCCQSFLGKFVQFTLSNILFDLAIPNLGIELKKPSTESGKFRRRETFNLLFDIFDLTHRNLLIQTLAEFWPEGHLQSSLRTGLTVIEWQRWHRCATGCFNGQCNYPRASTTTARLSNYPRALLDQKLL